MCQGTCLLSVWAERGDSTLQQTPVDLLSNLDHLSFPLPQKQRPPQACQTELKSVLALTVMKVPFSKMYCCLKLALNLRAGQVSIYLRWTPCCLPLGCCALGNSFTSPAWLTQGMCYDSSGGLILIHSFQRAFYPCLLPYLWLTNLLLTQRPSPCTRLLTSIAEMLAKAWLWIVERQTFQLSISV